MTKGNCNWRYNLCFLNPLNNQIQSERSANKSMYCPICLNIIMKDCFVTESSSWFLFCLMRQKYIDRNGGKEPKKSVFLFWFLIRNPLVVLSELWFWMFVFSSVYGRSTWVVFSQRKMRVNTRWSISTGMKKLIKEPRCYVVWGRK